MGIPLTLPQVASKVGAFNRNATVTIKPPVIQIREGLYTGADVRISSSPMSKVEVVAKIPIDERAGRICKMSASVGALIGFAIALLIFFSAVDEVRSVGLTARGERKVARGSVFLLIGGLVFGGMAAGVGRDDSYGAEPAGKREEPEVGEGSGRASEQNAVNAF